MNPGATVRFPPETDSDFSIDNQFPACLAINVVTESIPVVAGLKKHGKPQACRPEEEDQDPCKNKQCFP